MAKSKYSPELVTTICNAIAVYGLDEAGYKTGEISCQTFYDWQKKYPEFLEAVKAAKADYKNSSRDSLKRLANKALVNYLDGSMTKVTHTKKQTLDLNNDIIELEEWKTAPLGIPQWAIARALGEGLTEIEALTRLAELNLVPVWVVDCAEKILDRAKEEIAAMLRAELPEPLAYELSREREHSGGLSEATFNRIRTEVMGISDPLSSPKSPTPLSSEIPS
jgi:hypothetical protein